MERLTAENALRCLRDCKNRLLMQYVDSEPSEPGWELAVAKTPRPAHLADALDSLHAAEGHLVNLIESLTERARPEAERWS